MTTQPVMLSLCDLTTAMARPFADSGWLCYCVDIQHEPGEHRDGNIVRIGADLRDWIPPLRPVGFVAAFPPCTNLAVSGARWFRDKGLSGLIDALELVERCRRIADASNAPWFLENPVSTLSTYWRPPDHTFHPWEYGGWPGGHDDGYTKATCLWTGGGFVMPDPRPIDVDPDTGDRIHRAPPSPDRANFRSATPAGFAQAVFETLMANPQLGSEVAA